MARRRARQSDELEPVSPGQADELTPEDLDRTAAAAAWLLPLALHCQAEGSAPQGVAEWLAEVAERCDGQLATFTH